MGIRVKCGDGLFSSCRLISTEGGIVNWGWGHESNGRGIGKKKWE